MNIYRKLYSIKYEKILASVYIPYMLINTSKARTDLLLIALAMHLFFLLGLYFCINIARKEALKEIKEGTYIPLIDIKEIQTITDIFKNLFKSIKKEVIIKQYTNRQTYILKKN